MSAFIGIVVDDPLFQAHVGAGRRGGIVMIVDRCEILTDPAEREFEKVSADGKVPFAARRSAVRMGEDVVESAECATRCVKIASHIGQALMLVLAREKDFDALTFAQNPLHGEAELLHQISEEAGFRIKRPGLYRDMRGRESGHHLLKAESH
jgi:hypothetical protein